MCIYLGMLSDCFCSSVGLTARHAGSLAAFQHLRPLQDFTKSLPLGPFNSSHWHTAHHVFFPMMLASAHLNQDGLLDLIQPLDLLLQGPYKGRSRGFEGLIALFGWHAKSPLDLSQGLQTGGMKEGWASRSLL